MERQSVTEKKSTQTSMYECYHQNSGIGNILQQFMQISLQVFWLMNN